MAETQGMKRVTAFTCAEGLRGAQKGQQWWSRGQGGEAEGCRPAGEELILNIEKNRPRFIHTEEIEEGLRAWP